MRDSSNDRHGHGPRKRGHLTPEQQRWRAIKRNVIGIIKWGFRIGLPGSLIVGTAFAWGYTAPPASGQMSRYVSFNTVQQLPQHRFAISTPVSTTGYIELVVEESQDSYFAPDAWESFPYGWYGHAACLFVANNIFGHQEFIYGNVADFISTRDGFKVRTPDQPLAATATGWYVASSNGEQLVYDNQAQTFSISSSAHVTLFNQAGAPIRGYQFSLRLTIGFNGVFQCSMLTTGPPLV